MNKPTTNAKGEYENCAFHKPRSCAALKTWYNPVASRHCEGCPFFKEDGRANVYGSTHANDEKYRSK